VAVGLVAFRICRRKPSASPPSPPCSAPPSVLNLFFWQASQEVEDLHTVTGVRGLKHMPDLAKAGLGRIKVDTYIGTGFWYVVAFTITLTFAGSVALLIKRRNFP
jgi:hypothetical protein